MRVLFFSPYYVPYLSGLTNYPRQIFSLLKKKHKFTVLTFQYQRDLKKTELIEGVKVIRLPYWWRVSKGFISPQSWLAFWHTLKQHDLVLLNLPSAEGLLLAFMAKLQNKPVRAIFLCQVDLGSALIDRLISWMLKQVVLLQLFLVDRFVTLTKDYVDSLQLPLQIHSKAVYILPPVAPRSVDKAYFQKLKRIKKNEVWVGFVGRVAREKGLDYLVTALKHLSAHRSVTMVFAGLYGSKVVGEAGCYQRLRIQLKESGIKYYFFGKLSDNQLGSFYRAIDVLVLPSVNQTEAFGMVQLEAMQFGVPVITTNLPGVRVPVQLTGMGKIVEPKNTLALAQALDEVLDQPHLFNTKTNQMRLKKITDINQVITQYEKKIFCG